ncbi:MAG: acyltransferase [Schwartzia sp.]|nr:acyltransferase [Schwartzia sp. (in: firmicutes)]
MDKTKQRIPAIEYIRGVSMLGVVGIHVGSQYLGNPSPNLALVAFFEIATRFAVPIFFFISAFGLFYHLDMDASFDYRAFLRRRAKTVLVPYLVWSVFYMLHYTVLYRDTMLLHLSVLAKYLFFGFGSYQLYFMVILLWFYLLMPLWIWLVRRMTLSRLAALLVLQIAFDYWSSFLFNAYAIENPYLRALAVNRLNYWVLHYVFIFVLGGWLAVRFDSFRAFMERRRFALAAFFAASFASMLGYYYWLILVRGYDAIGAINTAHQLCPLGVIYTLAASLFLFALFTPDAPFAAFRPLLSFLGRHSYFVYLAHPLTITYLGLILARTGRVMTAPIALAFYAAVVLLTLGAAVAVRNIGERLPWVNGLTIGVWKK